MSRRFFSGDSIEQALLSAARHFRLEPDEIAYEEIEKRHGFLKVRRKVVIAVDEESPRRSGAAAVSPEPAPAPAPTRAESAAEPSPPPPKPLREERAAASDETARPSEPPAHPAPTVEPPAESQVEPPEPPPGAGDQGGGEAGAQAGTQPGLRPGSGSEPEPDSGPEPGSGPEPSAKPPERAGAGGSRRGRRGGRRGPRAGAGELVELPDAPRRAIERYPRAEGEVAAAADEGLRRLLQVADLDLEYEVMQGDERLEVELWGADQERLLADRGSLLLAIQHLVPRLVRGLSGEPVHCRVDCDNFHEIRAERLRDLGQRAAAQVAQTGKAKTLEPMAPDERRIIHLTLTDDATVETVSLGEGLYKRVMVKPSGPPRRRPRGFDSYGR